MARLVGLLVGAAALLGLSGTASAQPDISRAEIFEIAVSGVGSPYVWGGGCWDPADRGRLGADCSGYVGKVWQVPDRSAVTTCSHPYSTYNFYNERTHWDAVDRGSAEPADGFVYRSGDSGHIVLYASGDPWGSSEVYEARGTAYGIVHRSRTFSDSYRVRRRRALIPDGPPPHPLLTLSVAIDDIDGQPRDLCVAGASEGLFDVFEGQGLTERLYVSNEGTAVASALVVGISVAPAFDVLSYEIFDDWEGHDCGEEWCPNDANDHPDNPPHTTPGRELLLHLYSLSPGETKMIVLELSALVATFPEGTAPEVRLWVRSVADFYDKASYDSAFDNVGGFQTWNGGDLRAASRHTVLADESCNGLDDDCDGAVDDGLGVGEACIAGVGRCAAEGTSVCGADGVVLCDATPSEPQEETCNGLDDDCDGVTDEGCPGVELPDLVGPDGTGSNDDGPDGAGWTIEVTGLCGGCACRAGGPRGGADLPGLALLLLALGSLRRRGRRR